MHAYLIMAHKNQHQLIRLLKQLDDKENDIYLHIDQKTANQFDPEIIKNSCSYSGVYFLKSRKIFWGGVTQVACELDLLKMASEKKEYEYYHLISGQDFPLKNQKNIHAFFKANDGKEFINFSGKKATGFGIEINDRVNYKWHTQLYNIFNSNLYRKIIMRLDMYAVKLKKKILRSQSDQQYYHGANWFDITHDLAIDLVSHREDIIKKYRNGFCVDEVFLQTFVVNNGYFEKVYCPNNSDIRLSIKREIDWDRGNPYTWKSSDINYLRSSNCFFVRKVDEDVDNYLIEEIEKMLTHY